MDGNGSILIVLRGDSGSGKGTVARALQQELGGVWIEQDCFRRAVPGEIGSYPPLSVELVQQSAALRDDHAGPSLFHADDLTLAETLRRHATRPDKTNDFGEKSMRGWHRGWDPLLRWRLRPPPPRAVS